mmetsp:Transcript_22545/g.57218  ORF Transcript_22545/g.57218 Transcript_22545/m.57218 type:complete len:208 (-) Transcript_22545:871-1494(-)
MAAEMASKPAPTSGRWSTYAAPAMHVTVLSTMVSGKESPTISKASAGSYPRSDRRAAIRSSWPKPTMDEAACDESTAASRAPASVTPAKRRKAAVASAISPCRAKSSDSTRVGRAPESENFVPMSRNRIGVCAEASVRIAPPTKPRSATLVPVAAISSPATIAALKGSLSSVQSAPSCARRRAPVPGGGDSNFWSLSEPAWSQIFGR